jgi:Immunity protein 72
MFDELPIPKHLDEVPVSAKEILVRTDEEVPVFGIYEPQVKDGCMNYLLAGVPATSYRVGGSYDNVQPVTWKLIWEDTRYLDGHVSSEEDLYFPTQSKSAAPLPAFLGGDLISATTGQICPKDGSWAVMNDLQGKIKLKKGDTMPAHQGRDVNWVWG